MNENEIRTQLFNKLETEYNEFINKLKTSSPEQILQHSYEKVMKEEFVMMFNPESNNYDIDSVKVLNKSKYPLEELYQGWMDSDGGVHNLLEDSVEETIEFLRKDQKNKSKENER